MLNIIWLSLIVISVVVGAINGRLEEVAHAVTTSAQSAFTIILNLIGIITFWLGLMRIAEVSGLIQLFARLLQPVMHRLFPDIPKNHPAMGAMLLNIAANMLGLNNAATPFGLRAMQELNTLNKTPGTATNAMCTFLAINTSCVQLIPATAIAFLAAAGGTHPTNIIITSMIASSCALIAAVTVVKILEKLPVFKIKSAPEIASNSDSNSNSDPDKATCKNDRLEQSNL